MDNNDLTPFSLDDLDLEGGLSAGDDADRELGLTDEEVAGLDFGEFNTMMPTETPLAGDDDAPEKEDVDTGDPVLDQLIMLGQKQGFIDLTDIIAVVDNPEEEAERIEEIGWILHRAGIQIRDGDEIIDMEMDVDEEEAEVEPTAAAASEPELALVEPEADSGIEPDMMPFSLAELGLSQEEIEALGLAEMQSTPEVGVPAEAEVAPSESAEPELSPFSLDELGLSPAEIAALGDAESQVQDEPGSAAEPELSPFSLEELGLSPAEIAALEGLGEQTEEPPSGPAPRKSEVAGADFGLSPDEIAALGALASTSEPTPRPDASTRPPSVSSEASDTSLDAEEFDFSVVDETPRAQVAPAKRTAPRRQEEAKEPDPDDIGFEPESLEAMDDIWDQPEEEALPQPARIQLPPREERERMRRQQARREPAPARPITTATGSTFRGAATRPMLSRPTYMRGDPARAYLRPGPARTGSGGRSIHAVSAGDSFASGGAVAGRRAPAEVLASFLPTGDATLDDYVQQLQAEPDNYGMVLAVARLGVQTGRNELALYQYRQLIRRNAAIDEVIEELSELAEMIDDSMLTYQLYRLLGDAYSRQNRFQEAMAAYTHTLAG